MMPTTLAATRDALVGLLRAVPGVGLVHPHEVYAVDERGFRNAYLYTHHDHALDALCSEAHIRGWYLRRVATRETVLNVRMQNEHTWHVRGYMAFNNAAHSELIFDDLIERMRAAVRGPGDALGLPALLGTGGGAAVERGMQVSGAGPVIFAGVLCHSAVLELTTRHWVEARRP